MLTLTVPEGEMFRDATQEFVTIPEQTLTLEHSLISISKWEAIHHKPFLTNKPKTKTESIDYFRCMSVGKDVNPLVWFNLSPDIIKQITDYMSDPMTATTVKEKPGSKGRSSQVLTSELIYCYMAEYGIPFSCEKWHINRLLTLIRVCNARQEPQQKMKPRDVLAQNRMLNAARRKR